MTDDSGWWTSPGRYYESAPSQWYPPTPAPSAYDHRPPAVPPSRPTDRQQPLAALVATAAVMAVALCGGVVAIDHRHHVLSASALPGASSSAADASSRQSGKQATPTPKKSTTVPEPVLTVTQVANAVEPGVVIITSQLGYQNAEAAGTGMVLASSGVILTNNHVIAGATHITVTVQGTGRQYVADVVGTAVSNDIAVLQLEGASGLSTIPLGDSSSVKVGNSAVAIGNAGGQGSLTVVSGKVTSTQRTITASDEAGTSSERLTSMIEVQAPIRAGDSGGPLASRAGKVIGMDTAASADRGQLQASPTVGFAIPINRAITIAKQIRSGITTGGNQIGSRGYLGIQVSDGATISGAGGAQVVGSTGGSPAAAAGIQPGDTITYLNGAPVTSADGLTSTLKQSKPGQQVTVGWTDGFGEAHSAQVTLTSGPAD